MQGPTWIVCRDERQAQHARKDVRPGDQVRVITPTISQIVGAAPPQVIIVCEGVDLWQNVHGEGSLGSLLERRQLVWGDEARFIRL